jgi:hypothetical protein
MAEVPRSGNVQTQEFVRRVGARPEPVVVEGLLDRASSALPESRALEVE